MVLTRDAMIHLSRVLVGGALLLGACSSTPVMPEDGADHPANPGSVATPAGEQSNVLSPAIAATEMALSGSATKAGGHE